MNGTLFTLFGSVNDVKHLSTSRLVIFIVRLLGLILIKIIVDKNETDEHYKVKHTLLPIFSLFLMDETIRNTIYTKIFTFYN